MRLVNVDTLKLQEFSEEDIPQYAILSHRWGSEELSFREVYENRIDGSKDGYNKLLMASAIAAKYNVYYLWLDTCCIDKTSSAELSEAINSMFKWYRDSKICLAYLQDVKAGTTDFEQSFVSSVWFTRSWTLQELLAPRNVQLFDADWVHIRSADSNFSLIEDATAIPEVVLQGECSIWDCCIAERMSWAADRQATRAEDVAYSLMGVFDVNMPLLYGEGDKAFARLQEEIIRRSNEPTFLLWGYEAPLTGALLASSPSDFAGASRDNVSTLEINTAFSLTNIGLEIEGNVIRWAPGTFGLLIGEGNSCIYALVLREWSELNSMVRIGIGRVARPRQWSTMRKLTILRGTDQQRLEGVERRAEGALHEIFGFSIETEPSLPLTPTVLEYGGKDSREEQWVETPGDSGLLCRFFEPMRPAVARLICSVESNWSFCVDLSFDFDSCPCVLIYKHADRRPATPLWKISDAHPAPNTKMWYGDDSSRERDEDGRERKFIVVRDVVGRTALFLRASRHSDVFAKIPGVFVRGEHQVWARLIPPTPDRHQSPYYMFKLTDTKPAIPEWSTFTITAKTRLQGGVVGVDVCGHFIRLS